jgi:hypothetical protein
MKKAMRRYGSPNEIVTDKLVLQRSSKRTGLFGKAGYKAMVK